MKELVPQVDILLSVYNGEKHLPALLESIAAQTHASWNLIVRDDVSLDASTKIVATFADRHPGHVFFNRGTERLGACQSFHELLAVSTASYVMFCDQDDVWVEDKIELFLKTMQEFETTMGDVPILVHSDLYVVDQDLGMVATSFWHFQKINPNYVSLNRLLIQNNVTGCASMINTPLRNKVLPIPAAAIMHDWWIALVASAFGTIAYIDKPTVYYRQHPANDTGAKAYSWKYFLQRMLRTKESFNSNARIMGQGQAFWESYFDAISPSDTLALRTFVKLSTYRRLNRIYYALKYKLLKYGVLRNLGYLVVLWLMPTKF